MSKRKSYFRLLILFVVVGGAAVVWWTGLLAQEQTATRSSGTTQPAKHDGDGPKEYTATATLSVAPSVPHPMRNSPEEFDLDEFEVFRNTQAALIHQRFVLVAALRNSRMKSLPSILREDARRNTIEWLESIIKVSLEKKSSIMTVSATLRDRNEAATIVNAVVEAYMDEVVNRDRTRQRERLDSLNTVSVQMEEEVRKLREDLKRETEAVGASDSETSALRRQMALNTYAEYERELLAMHRDRFKIECRLKEATEALKELGDAKISDLEVYRLLVSIPAYSDLHRRVVLHELDKRGEQSKEELAAMDKMLDQIKSQCRTMLRAAKRIGLDNEVHKLTTRLEFANEHVLSFQKEVNVKSREADLIGRTTIATQMLRAKLDNVERILRGVAEERERLKIELDNYRARVTVVGDSNAPAAAPEKPD